MILKITLGNKDYTFLVGYQENDKYRTAFNILVEKIFSLSFEEWYKAGHWNEKYIPYTIFDGEKAVANASVNIMDLNILGEQQRYIQIGTVLTDEDYRNKSLSRFLMQQILQEWGGKSDLIYLFANSSVLGLYPKFGFDRVREYAYFKSIAKNSKSGGEFEQLNMDIQPNRDFLYNYAKNSKVFGKLSMKENVDLVMFYCTSFLKENVYYIKSLEVIVVAVFNDNQLHLWDIFGENEVELDKIINSLVNFKIDEVMLGFTPKDCNSYEVKEISGEDALFIQKGRTKLFETNKVMFPLLSHA